MFLKFREAIRSSIAVDIIIYRALQERHYIIRYICTLHVRRSQLLSVIIGRAHIIMRRYILAQKNTSGGGTRIHISEEHEDQYKGPQKACNAKICLSAC